MTAPILPPGIVRSGTDSAFGIVGAGLRAGADWYSSALRRGATPIDFGVDVLAWWAETARRDHPRWATEHQIVRQWPIARLRDFSTGPTVGPPTVLLPPQAGHDSCIVDYHADQSQIRTARAAGLTSLYSLDWIGASAATKNASIEEYIAVVHDTVEMLGGRVNLVGDCQGGWLAVIYAALYPETVVTLTIAGAPVDFHTGEPLIHDWLAMLTPTRDLTFYRALVAANGGILPGQFQLAGFMAMQPDKEWDRQLQLFTHIHDEAYVARYRTFETWFQHTQPINGAFFLWILEHLFQNNELIAGTLHVGDSIVDLGRITCPLYLLAGSTDHITPPPQVYALADHVGTSPDEIVRQQAPGGHLGLFMGHDALRNHWAPLFRAIRSRSEEPTSVDS